MRHLLDDRRQPQDKGEQARSSPHATERLPLSHDRCRAEQRHERRHREVGLDQKRSEQDEPEQQHPASGRSKGGSHDHERQHRQDDHMRVPDADDEVAGPDRVPGSDGGDGNRDRRRSKSRHGPGDGRDRSKIDRERARLQTGRMVAAHPIPRSCNVEVQRTWMMPAEPRIRADQQLSFQRLERIDLENRAVRYLAERRRMPRGGDETGEADAEEPEQKDGSKGRAISVPKRRAPREPGRSALPCRRGDTKPPTVRLFDQVGTGIGKTEQIHRMDMAARLQCDALRSMST